MIVSAQKLLEERAGEIGVLREDVSHGKRAQEGLQNTLADVKRDLAARDHTVSDLKAKIAELYVQFQVRNRCCILMWPVYGSKLHFDCSFYSSMKCMNCDI